jgi:hypothetical protein
MMRDRLLIPFALLAAAGAIAVAGCGGDDESSTTASTGASGASGASGPLTADQWATQADAICAQGDKDQNAALQQFFQQEGISQNQQPTDEQLTKLATDVIIPNIEQQIDAIKALPVPEDDADRVNEFLDQADSDLNALKDDPSLATDGNSNPFADTSKLAGDLGLKNCASG